MHSPVACHRFFHAAAATFQGQGVQLIPLSRGYSPATPLGDHSDMKGRIREEDQPSLFLAGHTGTAGVWGKIPRHPSARTARKGFSILQASSRLQALIYISTLVKNLPVEVLQKGPLVGHVPKAWWECLGWLEIWAPWRCKGCNGRFLTSPCLIGW